MVVVLVCVGFAGLLWRGHVAAIVQSVRGSVPWTSPAPKITVPRRLEQFFLETALSNRAWKPERPRVIKWDPGVVEVTETGPRAWRSPAVLRRELTILSSLTGKTTLSFRPTRGDIIVTYLAHRDYVRAKRRATGGGWIEFRSVAETGRITAVRMYVDAAYDGRRQALARLMTQALGLVGQPESPGFRTSILAQTRAAGSSTLTRLDRQAIRLLYDPRVRAGMSRAQFEESCGQTAASGSSEE